MKTSAEIRQEFISFFKNKKHTYVPSTSVIPISDPTLLFTNAGMNQFKDVFLDQGKRSYKRAVNYQKCIRVSGKHNDLEEVGHDTYHHTFFEMLGNWSFGDYYKNEAIQWAWELFTEIWKLPKDRLWATVFKDDDEAEKIWKELTDIKPKQVLKFDENENFWEMGETGPCGPCSEIHIDLGPDYCDRSQQKDHLCSVNGDCGRYIELWNLVFIQYNRDETGRLNPLPSKHVDTGMGFERIVAVLQQVRSNYETDLFIPILEKISQLTGINHRKVNESQKVAFQVIADHVRMLNFSIADGALPSNEGRGYVLRRILRRAARFARKLDMHRPVIYKLIPTLVELMSDAYPEIENRQEHVMEVIKSEEENFNKTLDRGIEIFESVVSKLSQEGENIIPGEEAFRLYDTYGFPLDLTRIMAYEKKLLIDETGFGREMEKQRERARKAGKFLMQFDHIDNWSVLNHCSSSVFVGYDKLEIDTKICKFLKVNGHYHIVLAETPFYAESGGQVADKGRIFLKDVELVVVDVQKENEEIVHICKGPENLEIIDSTVYAKVDTIYRYPTMYNHTATHLLHEALRRVLGNHIQQAGSLVTPDRMRFDFSHFKKIKRSELEEIENIVNEQIRADTPLNITYIDYNSAIKEGAIALFGEKYSDEVRVITIGDYSKELCGGTHVQRTGQIGLFVIVLESSIASGVRRIEAVTGPKAVEYIQNSRNVLSELSRILNVSTAETVRKVENLNSQLKENEKILQKMLIEQTISQVDSLISQAEKIGDVLLVLKNYQNFSIDLLKQVADSFRQKAKKGIIFLINKIENKINFVCGVTDDLVAKGVKAGELVKEAAKMTGGGGGGKPHLATAGGKNVDKLDEAIKVIRDEIKKISSSL